MRANAIIPSAARLAAIAAVTAVTASCGGETPVQPTPAPTVTAVMPSSGPAIGGTAITVTGSNFVAGAAVTIGGASASSVSVINSTTIAATTPPARVGPADVIVRLGGRAAALPGGFTYVQVRNAPPVVSSVTARGTRPNEPSHFADLNEELDVMATVSDAETSLDELTYQWSADVGTFTGSGRAVKWRAPGSLPTTPADYSLTLTVTEQYRTTDESGAVVTIENRVTGRATVHVHNSLKEVSDLAYQFLTDFSNSAASPEFVVRNFSTDGACGRRQERDEISDNRAKYTINSSSLGSSPRVTFDFGGRCPMFDGRPPLRGDACVQLACGWKSTVKATGTVQSVSGTCYLTEIYEASPDRWKLCWSQFRGSNTLTGEPVTGLSFRQP